MGEMKKMPMLIKLNPECLSMIQQSDINIPSAPRDPFIQENICCAAIKKADYLVLPSLGIARMNLNFCPCCGQRLTR